MKSITVIATEHPVPREENPRSFIDTSTPVTVSRTTYYQRRVNAGELRETTAQPAIATNTTAPDGANSQGK